MDYGEDVNRLAGSDRKTVVDRDSLWDAIRGTALNGIPQTVTIHNTAVHGKTAVSANCQN